MSLDLIKIQNSLSEMLLLQKSLNAVVNPQWREANYKFGRYAALELGEAMDHLGYKHWKKHCNDIEQFEIEIIDVFHFYLSIVALKSEECAHQEIISLSKLLYQNRYNRGLLNIYHESRNESDKEHIQDILDDQMILALRERKRPGSFNENAMAELLINGLIYDSEGLISRLRALYIPKNCLNLYRNRNGYTTGTYKKITNGREDNEFLADIIKEIPDASSEVILEELAKRIPQGV